MAEPDIDNGSITSILDNLRNPKVDMAGADTMPVYSPEEETIGVGETFARGLRAGARGMGADLNYLQALASSAIGDEEGVKRNVREASYQEGLAADALKGLEQFDEFIEEPTFDGFVTQVTKGTAQLVPYAISSILSAGFGAAAGVGTKIAAEGSKLAAKRIVKDSLEKTAKGIASPDEKEIAEATWGLAKRARYGAYAGAGASEFAPMSGSNFSEAIDSGEDPNDPMVAFRAAALGVPQAAIGVGGEVALLKLIGSRASKLAAGKEGTVMGRLAKDLGTGFLRGGAIEATTEVAQEGLSVLNRSEMDENFTAQDAQMRLGEAAFAAFFGGGAFSGAGSTAAGGIRELRNVSIPDSVKQKSRDLLDQGKQAITDITANEESFADGDTQFTNAEPQSDLKAQLAAMSDSDNAKAAVWVESPEPAYDAKPNGDISVKIINGEKVFVSYIAGRGTIISPYYDVVEGVRNDKASEDVLAAALGYSGTKPGDADRAVQVMDAQGRIITEQATNEAGEADAMVALQKQIPEGGSIRVLGAEEALLNRQEKVKAEAAPVVEDVVEDQNENLADYSFEQESQFENKLSLADSLVAEGDVDSALEIYSNVAAEGTEAQRQEAQDKINEILGNEPIVRDMNVDPVTGQTNQFLGGQSQDSMSKAPNSPSLAGQKQFENLSSQDATARRDAAEKDFAPKTSTGQRRKVRAATLADREKDRILAVTPDNPRTVVNPKTVKASTKEDRARQKQIRIQKRRDKIRFVGQANAVTQVEAQEAAEREAIGQRLNALAKAEPENERLQALNKQYQEADPQGRQDIVDALRGELIEAEPAAENTLEMDFDGADPDADVDFETGIENDVADPFSGVSEQSAQLTAERSYAEVPLDADGVIREYANGPKARQEFQEAFEGLYTPNFNDGGYWQRMSPFMLQGLVRLRKAGKEVEIEPPSRRASERRWDSRTNETTEVATYGVKVFSSEIDLFRHQSRKTKTITNPETGEKVKVPVDEQLLQLEEFLAAEVGLATSSQYAKTSGFSIEMPLAEYDPDTRQQGLMTGERRPINLVDMANAGRRLLATRLQQDYTAGSDADAFLEMINELIGRGYKVFVNAQGKKGNRQVDITTTQAVKPAKSGKQLRQEGSSILNELALYHQKVSVWYLENSDLPTAAQVSAGLPELERVIRSNAPDKPLPPAYLQPILNTPAGVDSGTGEKIKLRKVLSKNLTKTQDPKDAADFQQGRKGDLEVRTAEQQAVSKPFMSERVERFPFLGTEQQQSMILDFNRAREQQELAEEGIIDRPDFANNPGGNVDNPNPDRVESDDDVPYANYSVLTKPVSGRPAQRYNAPTISFPFGEPTVSANSPSDVVAVLKVAASKLQLKNPIAVVTLSQMQGLKPSEIAEQFGDPKVAKHFLKVARQLRDNPNALGRSITYKNAHFILVDDVSTSNDVETTLVAAHELGHAFFQEELASLVEKPVYKRMWQSFKDRDRSIKAYQGPHGFEEWFADNVAKWASAGFQNTQAKNITDSTFKKIAAKFKQMFNAVRTALRKRFAGDVDINVAAFINAVSIANQANYAANRQQGTAAQLATYPTFEKKAIVRAISDEVALTAGAKELGEALKQKTVGGVREAIRLAKPLRHVFFTANKNLRSINSRIADMFYVEAGASKRGSRMGFLQESDIQNREFEVAFEKAIGPLDSPEVIAAMEVAAGDGATAQLDNDLAIQIRNFLRDIHTNYVEPMQSRYTQNKKIGFQENYFPVVLNMQEIAQRSDEFKELILSQPSQASRNPKTARERVTIAVNRIAKYQDVVDNSELTIDEALDPNSGREERRELTQGIDREVLAQAGFLVPPVDAFRTYKKQLVKRVEWNRSTKDIFGANRLDPLLDTLKPDEKGYATEIINSYLGYGYTPMSPERRKWQSRLLAAQYTLLLPLAAIGSLPELAGPIIFSKEMNGFEMAFRQMKEGGMSQVEARQLAEDIGIVQDGAVSNAWMSTTEREFMDDSSRAWTDGFFKVTGLEWFTNFTRSFSTGMAVQFLLRHATNEAGNDRSGRYLADLGVTAEQVKAWDKGNRDLTTPEGRAVKFAIQKFVESSILRPNAAERPVWASDPRWALVWQLKSYFYAFYTKIIGGIRREAVTRLGEGEGGARIAAATGILALSAVALLPLAMAGMELREYAKTGAAEVFTLGQSDKNYFRTDSMDWGTYISEAIEKTGVYGPLSIVSMAHRSSEWNGSISGLAALLGPTFESIEAILGRGEFERLVPAAAVL